METLANGARAVSFARNLHKILLNDLVRVWKVSKEEFRIISHRIVQSIITEPGLIEFLPRILQAVQKSIGRQQPFSEPRDKKGWARARHSQRAPTALGGWPESQVGDQKRHEAMTYRRDP